VPAPAAQAPLLECDAAHKAALQNAEERVTAADKLWGRINGELEEQRRKLVEADDSRARGEAVASLFDWTRLGFDHYLRQKEWGSRDYLQKQLGVVAYMGESICDVAIAEDRNKSRSPGCEGLLPGGGQLREVVVADDDDDDDDD
jgi:hypothetical protein